jgi:hypothetical protein
MTGDHHPRLDDGILTDSHIRIDIDRIGIDETNTFIHPCIDDPTTHDARRIGQFLPRVDAEAFVCVINLETLDPQPLRNRKFDDICQVELALLIIGFERRQTFAQQFGAKEIDAGISFLDLEFCWRRIGSFDDSHDSPIIGP